MLKQKETNMDGERMSRRVKTNKRILLIGGLVFAVVAILMIAATMANRPPEHRVFNAPEGAPAASIEIPEAYADDEYREIAEHLEGDHGERTYLFYCDTDAEPAANVVREDGELVVRTYHDDEAACG